MMVPGKLDDARQKLELMPSEMFILPVSSRRNLKLDYATIKYNTTGTQQWIKRFNGESNDTDCATSIDLDVYNNVYVTGYSKSLP